MSDPPKCVQCDREICNNITMCAHLFASADDYQKHLVRYGEPEAKDADPTVIKSVFGQRIDDTNRPKVNKNTESQAKVTTRRRFLKAMKALKCPTCGKTFASEPARERHIRANSCVRAVEKLFSCQYCSKRFSRQTMKLSHEAWCAYKTKVGHTKPDQMTKPLGSNLEGLVFDKEAEAIKNGTLKKLKCPNTGCIISVTSQEELDVHVECHIEGTATLQCAFCEFRPSHSAAWFPLKEHIIAKHAGRLEPRFKCTVCGKGFAKKHKIVDHLQTHSDVRKYTCAVCGSDFKQESSLRVHVLESHSSDEQREQALDKRKKNLENRSKTQKLCYICGYSTNSRGYFNTHMNIHKGIKPFSCDYCDYATVDSACYRRHMWRHKAEKPYQCSECGYTAIQKSQLNLHFKTKHAGNGSNVAQIKKVRGAWSKNKIAWTKQTLDDVLKTAGIEGSVEVVTTEDGETTSHDIATVAEELEPSATVEIQIGDTVVVATQENLTYNDYVNAYSYGTPEVVEPEKQD